MNGHCQSAICTVQRDEHSPHRGQSTSTTCPPPEEGSRRKLKERQSRPDDERPARRPQLRQRSQSRSGCEVEPQRNPQALDALVESHRAGVFVSSPPPLPSAVLARGAAVCSSRRRRRFVQRPDQPVAVHLYLGIGESPEGEGQRRTEGSYVGHVQRLGTMRRRRCLSRGVDFLHKRQNVPQGVDEGEEGEAPQCRSPPACPLRWYPPLRRTIIGVVGARRRHCHRRRRHCHLLLVPVQRPTAPARADDFHQVEQYQFQTDGPSREESIPERRLLIRLIESRVEEQRGEGGRTLIGEEET
mmetsp:Transcript_31062/g.93174  ORF Transcript_31062/g.93174 Transcript_31062/m.93174 type:complete len:300 (+) Transcript_31062:449-1348(+)